MACSVLLPTFGAIILITLCSVEGGRDSMGKEFIISFMDNREWTGKYKTDPLQNDVELYMTTTSLKDAQVTVTAPLWRESWKQTAVVKRGTTSMVRIPWQLRGRNAEKSNKGVHIEASEEISAYLVNKEVFSTDAYIALPLDVLGTDYYAVTYQSVPTMSIVGCEADTEVTIEWPSSAVVKLNDDVYSSKNPTKLTLNKFETLHMVDNSPSADFTGAHITSSKPVAVVSGNKKVGVSSGGPRGTADHLTEMLLPVDTWGKLFFTTSTPDRGAGDLFRIVAAEDDTTVRLSTFPKGREITLNAGEYKEVDLNSGDYQTVKANKPVMIAMIGKSKQTTKEAPNGGDPAMSLLVPRAQYASDYTWSTVQTPQGSDFDNKVVVIVKTSEKGGIRLDGEAVEWDEEKEIHGSSPSYTHFWKKVTPGSHNVYHLDPTVTFMAIASGTAQANSYAYDAGLRLAQINKPCTPSIEGVIPGDIIDNDCDGAIDEEKANGEDDDGDGKIDEDLALPPRIDGEWGAWSAWTGGAVTRERQCNNPAPENNGEHCHGEARESATCKHEL